MAEPDRWRREARAAIDRTMFAVAADHPELKVRMALSASRPDILTSRVEGDTALDGGVVRRRVRWWGAAVRAALGSVLPGRKYLTDGIVYFVGPHLWLTVRCGWCGGRPPSGAPDCMLCAGHWRHLYAAAADPAFGGFRAAASAEPWEPLHRLALSDYLEDVGHDGLAAAVRATAETMPIRAKGVSRG